MADIKEIEVKLQKATERLRDAETEKKIAESKLKDINDELVEIKKKCIDEIGVSPDKLNDIIAEKTEELKSILDKVGTIDFSDDDNILFSEENLKKVQGIYDEYKDKIDAANTLHQNETE